MSLSRWTKQFARVGRDGFHLARAILQDSTARRAVSFKPVLLEQARHSNKVANSLLQMDRQMGLVRYYGFMGYLQRRFQPALQADTIGTVSSQHSFSTSSSTTTAPPARVAFMITTSMKEELTEKLGYDMDQVKQMTPLQASLVLHHQIGPDSFEEKLPIVEKEHQEQVEKDQQQRQLEIKAQEKATEEMEMKKKEEFQKSQEEKLKQQQGGPEELVVSQEGSGSSTAQQPKQAVSRDGTFAYHSTNLLLSPVSDPENEFAPFWFEVIETNTETDETSRVGLYQDEKEAIIGMETRQDIAAGKGRPLKFEMKPVDKAQLFSSYS
eukprot:scaffold2334_cov118-Cylindrotheca_fusiformis.AAC.28